MAWPLPTVNIRENETIHSPCSWDNDPAFKGVNYLVYYRLVDKYPLAWIPTVEHANTAGVQHFLGETGTSSYVHMSNGRITFNIMTDFISRCFMADQLYKFPFDTQTCFVVLTNWDQNHMVRINIGPVLLYRQFIQEADVWQLVSENTSSKIMEDGYDGIEFTFVMSRKPVSYVISIVVPTAALVGLQITAFAMPPYQPDRPAFSMTLLLAFFFLSNAISSLIPQTSIVILIVIYTTSQMLMSAFLTGYFLIINRFAECKTILTIGRRSIRLVSLVDVAILVSTIVFVVVSHLVIFHLMLS